MATDTNIAKTATYAEWVIPVTTVATVFRHAGARPGVCSRPVSGHEHDPGRSFLLSALYILKPVQFSVFPTLLLFLTLFRISLNIASTRRILLHGNGGLPLPPAASFKLSVIRCRR